MSDILNSNAWDQAYVASKPEGNLLNLTILWLFANRDLFAVLLLLVL